MKKKGQSLTNCGMKPRKKKNRSEDEILLESQRHEIKEMVHKEREDWGS